MKEIIGMKLSDALCKIPDDKIICIGAATGFVFCGKKEQFLEDENLIYILSFTDLKNRIVKDAYLRLHKNGIVILVEGKEKGIFWDEDEYSEWRRTEGGCI